MNKLQKTLFGFYHNPRSTIKCLIKQMNGFRRATTQQRLKIILNNVSRFKLLYNLFPIQLNFKTMRKLILEIYLGFLRNNNNNNKSKRLSFFNTSTRDHSPPVPPNRE